jgi:hypothetical protein
MSLEKPRLDKNHRKSKKPLLAILITAVAVAVIAGGMFLYLNRNITLFGKFYHSQDSGIYFLFDGTNNVTFYENGIPFVFPYEIKRERLILSVGWPAKIYHISYDLVLSKDRNSFIDQADGAQYSLVSNGNGVAFNRLFAGRYTNTDDCSFYLFDGLIATFGNSEQTISTFYYTVFGRYLILRTTERNSWGWNYTGEYMIFIVSENMIRCLTWNNLYEIE